MFRSHTDLVFELLGEEGYSDAGLSYHLTHSDKTQISEPTNTPFFHTKRGREDGKKRDVGSRTRLYNVTNKNLKFKPIRDNFVRTHQEKGGYKR